MITYMFLGVGALALLVMFFGPKGYRTILTFGVASLAPLVDIVVQIMALPEWQAVIPQEWWSVWALGLSLAGVILRAKTSTPLGRGDE